MSLQNSLLSPELASPDHQEWTAIFSEILFPLVSRLLRPEVYQTDPVGMSETRVQASRLLCNIFLHYLVLLSEWNGMLDLWLKILDIMDRLMNSGQGDNLEEAVPESLKNILLIMADGGFLTPPQDDKEPSPLWRETCRRVDRFLPGMLEELFPQASRQVQGAQTSPSRALASKPTAGETTPRPSTDVAVTKGEEEELEKDPPPVTKASDVD